METDQVTQKELIEFLEGFQEKAWTALVHHKTQIHKIVFWSIGLLITLLMATKVFGVLDTANAITIREMIISGEFLIILFLAFLAILMFVVHHHLCSSFYITMLKYANEQKEVLRPGHVNLINEIRSPYFLYQSHLVKRRKIFRYSISATYPGMIGSGIYVAIVVLAFLLLGTMSLNNATFGSLRINLNGYESFAITFMFLSILCGLLSIVVENTRRKSRRELKQKFNSFQSKMATLEQNELGPKA